MKKKFKLTEETITLKGAFEEKDTVLYRIEALRDFSFIKKGDKGGFVEKEENLSHWDNCWIYDNAMVFDNAKVFDDAKIYNEAKISGNANVYNNAVITGTVRIFGNTRVYETAEVYGNAAVHGNAKIYGNSQIYDDSNIFGNASVYGDAAILKVATVCGNASVYGHAYVMDSATVCDSAKVHGHAHIFDLVHISGNAEICGSAEIKGMSIICGNGYVTDNMCVADGHVTTDLTKDLKASIMAQTGLAVLNNKVIAYKQVRKDLSSFFSKTFIYPEKGIIEVEAEQNNKSCASGLHFSNANYWLSSIPLEERNTFKTLVAEIDLNDIVTVQAGKIRCRKANILGVSDC